MKAISVLVAFLLFLFCFVFPKQALAATFSFNIATVSATTILSADQEIEVSLSIANLPSESYFRIALQKESGGSYFGYVKNNNGDWAAIQALNGDCTIYYKISDTSITSLVLKFKLGEAVSVDNGNYKLRAHKFTNSCKSNAEATNDYSFAINLPTPIPSSTPTPTSTNTPTPIPTKSPTPTPKPSTPAPSISLDNESSEEAVLGESSESAAMDSSSNSSDSQTTKGKEIVLSSRENNIGKILIILGFVFILACGILFSWPHIRNKLKKNE